MDYKAEFAKAQAEWNYKSEFAKAQAEWNSNSKKVAEPAEKKQETDAATATPEALYPEADPATKERRPSIKKKKRKSSKKVTKNENENGIEMIELKPVAASSSGGVTASPATIAPPSAPGPTVVPTSVIPPQSPASTAVNTGAAVAIPALLPEQAPPKPTKQPSSRPTPSKSKSKSLNKAKSSKKWPSSTVTVEIHKQHNKPIGIKFAEHKGKVIIGDIDKDGLAYPTELHKGMIVLSINNQRDFLDKERRKGAGKNSTQRYVDQIESNLTAVPEGGVILGIVVQHPLGFIPICITNPTTASTELGLGFGSATEELKKKKKEQQIVVITSIEPNSPADNQTMLQEGMILRAINHKKCSPTITTKQAFDSIYSKGVVKMLVQPCNEYSRKAKTKLLDTYNKPPPTSKKGELLSSNGYWVQIRYFGIKDIATLPMKLTLKATAGVHQTKKKKVQSIYCVDGKAYNHKGKYMGEESKYFMKSL